MRLQLEGAGWRGTSRVGNGWERLRMKHGKPQGGWSDGGRGKPEEASCGLPLSKGLDP